MLPSSIRTFLSLTHAPSTPLSVLVARATASFMASSKLVSEVALNSVTRATLIASASLAPSLPGLVAPLICGPATRESNTQAGTPPKDTPALFVRTSQNSYSTHSGAYGSEQARVRPLSFRRVPRGARFTALQQR